MGYWGVQDTFEQKMKGKKLKSVKLSDDKEAIEFEFQDGTSVRFGVEGDCCSHSWIEHLESISDVDGATLLEMTEDTMNGTNDDEKNPVDEKYGGRFHECLDVYQTHFKTDRGEITLEYRNSSNGYYGGYLVDRS